MPKPELREHFPASARFLGEPIPRHQAMIDGCEAQLAEPVRGIVTSGGPVEGLFPLGRTGLSFERVAIAEKAFTETLALEQRKAGSFELDSLAWRRWCNIHRFLMRHGLLLDGLSEPQRARVIELVTSILSPAGIEAVRGVMRLNETIQEISNFYDQYGYPEFGEWMYWISLFGEPSDTEPWGWQLDGHHLNINCLVLGDQIVATPFFLGSEPLFAEEGKFEGVRVLDQEEQRALDLVHSLDDAQLAKAVVSETMPPGLFTGAFSDNVVIDYEGITVPELSGRQQELCLSLIEVYIGRLSEDIAAEKMREVREHLAQTYFSWMGGTSAEDVFYYRVHSPVVFIEFDHEPGIVFKGDGPMKSHVHTMLRTPNGNDYGTDYLRQHRASHHHEH